MKEEDGKEIMGKARKEIYRSLFFKEAAILARIGRTVYVRQEYHERIRRIARVIGSDDVTLFSYIDNVLAEHFAANKEVISALYDEHNRPIF